MIRSSIQNLVRYLIAYSRVKYLLLLMILVLAVEAITDIRRYAYPQIDFREIQISVYAPGYTAEEMVRRVVTPVEEEIRLIGQITETTSKSYDSFAFVHVRVDGEGNMSEILRDIQDVAERVADVPEAPQGRISVNQLSSSDGPVLSLGLVSKTADQARMHEHARALKQQIEAVPGVAIVASANNLTDEIQVSLDREALFENNLSILEVNNAIYTQMQSYFLTYSGGTGDSANLQTYARSELQDSLANVIVRERIVNGEQQSIAVSDIGRVEETLVPAVNEVHHYNGEPGLGLDVIALSSVDVINLVDAVQAVIAEYETQAGDADLELVTLFDGSQSTRERLSTVYGNIAIGLGLVLLTLIVFLSRMIAFWVTVGLLTTIGMTFISIEALGVSLNSISLCAMLMSLGVIVDAAIVVSENVYTFKERGYRAREAALDGVNGIFKPLLIMQLTTIAAFATIFLVEGNNGLLAREIPIVAISMLAASLIEAIIFLPAHLGSLNWTTSSERKSLSYGQGGMNGVGESSAGQRKVSQVIDSEEEDAAAFKQFSRMAWHRKIIFFGRLYLIYMLKRGYTGILQVMMRRKMVAFVLIVSVFTTSFVVMLRTSSFEMYPIAQANVLEFSGEVTEAQTLDEAVRTVEAIEEIIESLPNNVILSTHSVIGRNFYNHFDVFIRLVDFSQREETAEGVRDFIFAAIADQGLPVTALSNFIDAGGPRSGSPIEIFVVGDDDTQREEYARSVEQDLATLGFVERRSDLRPMREDQRIRLVTNAHLLGLTAESIETTLESVFEGSIVGRFQGGDEENDYTRDYTNVRIRIDGDEADLENQLSNVLFRLANNQYDLLENWVEQEGITRPSAIYHYNGTRQNTVSASFDKDAEDPSAVYQRLVEQYDVTSPPPEGVTVVLRGESEDTYETLGNIIFVLIVAIILIYFFLILQFNNFAQPLIAVSAIPIALLGTWLMFGLHNVKFSLFAMLGMVGASGVVVNVSLVMVEFINQKLNEYRDKWQALNIKPSKEEYFNAVTESIIIGVRGRFRPIFITTLTTLMGIVSTVYGFVQPPDSFIFLMTLAMFWGIATGTLGTLFVIPFFYMAEKQISYWLRENIFERSPKSSNKGE